MVPANSGSLEVDSEDDDLNTGKIEEDTGLTQQPRSLCPALPLEEVQGTHREHLHTPLSPRLDQGDEDGPEYTEQLDNPREHSRCDSPTEGTNENTLEIPQPTHVNHEVSINTGYPDIQDTNAGSPGALETNTPSDICRRGKYLNTSTSDPDPAVC